MPLQLYDKDRILDACLAVFARHGYEKTATAMLAEAAGISKALIFHHFKNKKELYLSVLDHCFDRARADMGIDLLPSYRDFFKAMREFSITKLHYYQMHPDVYRVMREALHATPQELKADIQGRYSERIAAKQAVWEHLFETVPLREGVDRGQAFELVMMILDRFEDEYLSLSSAETPVDEAYLQRFLDRLNSFMAMIRYGVEASAH